jgi:3-hydroxyacyl-CoA dehydrogenase/enoyl-CoA hydratase/3-hydroxybutyryl-CoA epimerase
MTAHTGFRHWILSLDEDRTLNVTLDRHDSSQNSLSYDVMKELDDVITRIEEVRPRVVALRSGKDGSFIVGADVSEFTKFNDPDQVADYLRGVHRTLHRLEHLAPPTIAVIDGPCLGGGLELALACRYRIAVDTDATSIGFPEIKLGIHPGFGGTVRSIRRIGALPALQLMLTGRSLTARQADEVGLVDASVPLRVLDNAIRIFINDPPAQRRPSLSTRLTNSALLRPPVAWYLKRKAAEKADPRHYPAPRALIDLWNRYGDKPEQMYRAEAESVADLLNGSTARNLVRVFFLQMQLKNLAKKADPISRVHVIGAGSMGRDIAAWCALQGLHVSLQDLDQKALGQAIAAADKLFRKKLRKTHRIQAAHDRLMADPTGLGIKNAELIIEAIVEDADTKRTLYRNIEPRMASDAILASNTSSIPLEELAAGLEHPERFLGLHFFNPVPRMPLVEVVNAKATSEDILTRAEAFVKQIRRLPLPVKSAPGFLVNRVLMPYLIAAVKLVEEGYDAQTVDQAALNFGMPLGPLHLADSVGLDICLSVAHVFAEYFDKPIPDVLPRMVNNGRLGIKSGEGFFQYKNGRKRRNRAKWKKPEPPEALTSQLLGPLFAEAQACLDEGIVASADLVDAGMIFGTGFAPFTGGPMHYLREREGSHH